MPWLNSLLSRPLFGAHIALQQVPLSAMASAALGYCKRLLVDSFKLQPCDEANSSAVLQRLRAVRDRAAGRFFDRLPGLPGRQR